MRQCPFKGCGKPIPSHIFACGPHWRRLNAKQKRAISVLYDDYQSDVIGMEEIAEGQRKILEEVENA